MNSTSTSRVVTFAPICAMSPPPPSLARHESNSTEASLDSFYWKHGGTSDDDDRTNSFEIDDHFTSFGSFDETGSYLMARATLNPLQEDELPSTAMMTTTTMAKVPKATHHHRPYTMTIMTGQPQPYYARQESAISLLSSWGSLTFEETSSHYSAGSRRTLTYPTMEAKNRTTVMTGGSGLLSLSNHKSSNNNNNNKNHHHAMVPRPKLTTALSKKTLLVNYRQESNISLMSSWGSLDLTEQDEESILSQQEKQQTYRDNDDNDDDDASSFGAAVMPTMMRSSSNSVEPGNNSLAAFRQKQQQRLLQRSISLKQLTTEFRKARASPSTPSMLQSVKNGYYS